MSSKKSHRAFRIEDDIWQAFQAIASEEKNTASELLVKFVEVCVNKNSTNWIDLLIQDVNTAKQVSSDTVDTNSNNVNTVTGKTVDTLPDNLKEIVEELLEKRFEEYLNSELYKNLAHLLNENNEFYHQENILPTKQAVTDLGIRIAKVEKALGEKLESSKPESTSNAIAINEPIQKNLFSEDSEGNNIPKKDVVEEKTDIYDNTTENLEPLANIADNTTNLNNVAKSKGMSVGQASELIIERGLSKNRNIKSLSNNIRGLKVETLQARYQITKEKIGQNWVYFDLNQSD